MNNYKQLSCKKIYFNFYLHKITKQIFHKYKYKSNKTTINTLFNESKRN